MKLTLQLGEIKVQTSDDKYVHYYEPPNISILALPAPDTISLERINEVATEVRTLGFLYRDHSNYYTLFPLELVEEEKNKLAEALQGTWIHRLPVSPVYDTRTRTSIRPKPTFVRKIGYNPGHRQDSFPEVALYEYMLHSQDFTSGRVPPSYFREWESRNQDIYIIMEPIPKVALSNITGNVSDMTTSWIIIIIGLVLVIILASRQKNWLVYHD